MFIPFLPPYINFPVDFIEHIQNEAKDKLYQICLEFPADNRARLLKNKVEKVFDVLIDAKNGGDASIQDIPPHLWKARNDIQEWCRAIVGKQLIPMDYDPTEYEYNSNDSINETIEDFNNTIIYSLDNVMENLRLQHD